MSSSKRKTPSPILVENTDAKLGALSRRLGGKPFPRSGEVGLPTLQRVHCAGQLELFGLADAVDLGSGMRCPCPVCSQTEWWKTPRPDPAA